MTEETKEVDESIDYEQIEAHIDDLHDSLDEIKETGRQLGQQLIGDMDEADEEDIEYHQQLINRSFKLTERVEKGDKSVVRGK